MRNISLATICAPIDRILSVGGGNGVEEVAAGQEELYKIVQTAAAETKPGRRSLTNRC